MNPRMTTRAVATTIALALGFAPSSAAPAFASSGIGADLDSLVRSCMAIDATPGMAVAVVRGKEVIWERGYGHADREAGREVTPTTAFFLASTTKAFTALAAARLAARGELELDAPLSRALRGARFPAGVAPESIRVRDLLTHTHGIDPEGPIVLRVAWTGDYTNDLLLELLGAHKPSKNGRAFRYSNLGYDLTGVLLAPKTTHGWKDVVDREVFRPLGMSATTAYRSRVPEATLAQPYELGPNGFERVRLAKEDANMGPAGGHFSTARDLARFLVAELNGGTVPGSAGVPREIIERTQRLAVTQDVMFGPYRRHGWGLGWDLGTYEGDTLIHRFGTFSGYRSHVSFMPGRGLGVVVLVNGGDMASPLADVAANAIYDRLLGRPGVRERLRAGLDSVRLERNEAPAAIAADRAKRAARSQTLPRPLEVYAGRYVSPEFGTLELRLERNDRLEAQLGVARSAVEVFDATKNLLRVELLGRGTVLEVSLGPERAEQVTFLGRPFRRE